jgi:hypothetical protein
LLDKAALPDFVIEVVRKLRYQFAFIPLSCYWMMERTFSWMIQWCRLVQDYEQCVGVTEQLIYAAMGDMILRRLFDQN